MDKKGAIMFFSILVSFIIFSMFGIVSAERGYATAPVPVTTIDLTEQGEDNNIKPGRLKFEFDEKLYAIQVRRVEQGYVWFLVMTLDMDKQNDITAYNLDSSFNLSSSETKEIDLNKDGINDIIIKLKDIISTGKYNSVKSADFFIKKINNKDITNFDNENILIENVEAIDSEIQAPILEPVIVLNQKSQKQLTLLEIVISWFKRVFK